VAAKRPDLSCLPTAAARLAWDIARGGPQDPGRHYTPAMVTAKLRRLDIRWADQVLRTVRTPGGERTAIDTLVRARRPAQRA
jgi:hypothetical protein